MRLSEINIYPIKSTRGISLKHSEVLPRGLPWDRRWMLIDTQNRFITARNHPKLALIETFVGDNTLRVQGPNMSELRLPLYPNKLGMTPVEIWRDRCEAVLVGRTGDEWFSEYLSMPLRLVQMTDAQVRPVDPEYGQRGDEVSFADGYPLLLTSQASLDDLNRRLATPVSMRRFRPNIVVTGAEAYAEDRWRRFRVGEVEFEGVKNCSRCIFTTINPNTAEKDLKQEPLRTLGTYRRRPAGGVFFGQNLIPRTQGVIHVGDRVEILETV